MSGFFEKAKSLQEANENVSVTENGAIGYRSTGKSLLDMNFSIPKFRDMPENEICEMWEKAYMEDPLLALRWLFYVRDVRGGLGERRVFRVIIKSIANKRPNLIRELIISSDSDTTLGGVFPIYGRWDDLIYIAANTKMQDGVFDLIRKQLFLDAECNTPSLLAKWLKSENASSKETKMLGNKTRIALGLTHKNN